MRLTIVLIAMGGIALAGCGPLEQRSTQHDPALATTSAASSDTPFSQYDLYPNYEEQPDEQADFMLNHQTIDEAGLCGYGYE